MRRIADTGLLEWRKFIRQLKKIIDRNNGYKLTRGGLVGSLYTYCLVTSDRNLEPVPFTDVMAVVDVLTLDDEIAVGDTLVPNNAE